MSYFYQNRSILHAQFAVCSAINRKKAKAFQEKLLRSREAESLQQAAEAET